MPSNQPEGERREEREGEHTVGGEDETHVAGIIGPGEETWNRERRPPFFLMLHCEGV